MKRIPYLLLMFAMLAGCTTVHQPLVTVKDLNVVSLDPAGAGMELFLRIKNPNSFDVRLQGYSYDLKVMALPLAKGGAREEIKFAGGAETDLRIPIRITYGDLLEIIKRRPDPDKVPYQLAAGLDIETPVGQMTVPINRTGTYAIPKQYRPAAVFGVLGNLLKF